MNRPRWSWKVWPARRLVQVAVVLVMLALPLVSRYANYLAARQVDKVIEQWDGAVQGELLAGADRALRAGLPDGEGGVPTRRPRKAVLERTALFYGSPWSARLFGLSLTDLLAGAESAFASHRVATVLLVGLAVPFLGTLLLGRVFCSWICPMGLLFELGDKLRRGLRFLEISPLAVRFSRANKYLLLALGLLFGAALGLPLLHYVYPPALLARESHTFVMALFDRAEAGRPGFAVVGLTGATLFLLALVGLEVFVAPRFWCATLCPGGALYSLAGRFRLLRVRRNQATCTHCTLCDVACPMALKPMTDRTGMECDNCGICIDVCPERSLVFRAATTSAGFRPVPPPAPDTSAPASSPSPAAAGEGRGGGMSASPSLAAPRPTPDIPAPPPPAGGPGRAAAAAALTLGLVLGAAGPVYAHHILGIPHYAYEQSYPQAPVLKLLERVGPWELQMTGYPGNPAPGSRSEIHAYIVDTRTRALHDGPVTLEVYRIRAIGGRERVYGPDASARTQGLFKFFPTYPVEGNYELVTSFHDGEAISTLTFPLVVGDPGSPWLGLVGYLGGFGLFLVVIRAIRIKRARRRGPGLPLPEPAAAPSALDEAKT